MDERITNFFSTYASDFNAIYGNEGNLLDRLVNHLFRKSMRIRYEMTLAGCWPISGKDILDVGCGPGHYSVALARMGARSVHGVDVADGMLQIARERAVREHVSDRCQFTNVDFVEADFTTDYDYVVVMGLMDYVERATAAVAKILSVTREKAFFSFPAAGGILGWQRMIRYRKRCPLFLYDRRHIEDAFSEVSGFSVKIEKIARDYFVTASRV